jgi:uncharacterized membrane protein YvlD (DUF360 family)
MGTLISLVINAFAFMGISKLLPGFRVKNERTAIIIALVYSLLGIVAALIASPLVVLVTVVLAFFAFIPVIGPLVAASGIFVTLFLVSFVISAILLVIIDKMMDDFEMDSMATGLIASVLLAIINVVVRAVLPI